LGPPIANWTLLGCIDPTPTPPDEDPPELGSLSLIGPSGCLWIAIVNVIIVWDLYAFMDGFQWMDFNGWMDG